MSPPGGPDQSAYSRIRQSIELEPVPLGRSGDPALGCDDASRDNGEPPLSGDERAVDMREEEEALLGGHRTNGDIEQPERLGRDAVACLLLQHLCSTFTTGLYDFGAFLFLVQIFPDSLVPASVVGLSSTLTGLVWSGRIGGLVDETRRISFVRWAIGGQKAFYVLCYALLLLLLSRTANTTLASSPSGAFGGLSTWAPLGALVGLTSVLTLFNTGLTVAFERDWVTTIAQGNNEHLTFLNTWMRRIDLCSKLGAPLVVSVLTTLCGYLTTCLSLLALAAVTMALELLWVQVVYRRFPALAVPPASMDVPIDETRHQRPRWSEALKKDWEDWEEFSRLPIFYSSLAIASIYLTTLSYDGTFITYLKAMRGADDAFVAAMRGVCILTGLAGTLIMPWLEGRLGLERAGAWSLWFEVGCLGPVVLAFFVGAPGSPSQTARGPWVNSLVLFGGIALSRIGLWSFDLCQLKELQLALEDHPRRNRLTALQLALQNFFDLLKYALTLGAATPKAFKWTALVSWVAVASGGVSYAIYLRKVRGHLVHFEWFRKKM